MCGVEKKNGPISHTRVSTADTMGETRRLNVLFCCLGNICRSPMAEAVFAHKVHQHALEEHFGVIDSCGTADYHEGEEPDMRCVSMF